MTAHNGDSDSGKIGELRRQIDRLREAVAKVEGDQRKIEGRDSDYKTEQINIGKNTLRFTAVLAFTAIIAGGIAIWQSFLARRAIEVSREQFVASRRPWLKIDHRAIQPLVFNAPAWKGPIASYVVQDRIENVGDTVALDVTSWEDIFPLGPNFGYQEAIKKRNERCDHDRYPTGVSGYALFPKEPMTQDSHVGPPMQIVNAAVSKNGTIAFAMVGCVVYRSPMEPKSAPTHQTRFLYLLGRKVSDGVVVSVTKPEGTVTDIVPINIPDQWSAD